MSAQELTFCSLEKWISLGPLFAEGERLRILKIKKYFEKEAYFGLNHGTKIWNVLKKSAGSRVRPDTTWFSVILDYLLATVLEKTKLNIDRIRHVSAVIHEDKLKLYRLDTIDENQLITLPRPLTFEDVLYYYTSRYLVWKLRVFMTEFQQDSGNKRSKNKNAKRSK